jgi:hypothetical protein
MLSKNVFDNLLIRSGMYSPLSSAKPFTTAFCNDAKGAFLLVL